MPMQRYAFHSRVQEEKDSSLKQRRAKLKERKEIGNSQRKGNSRRIS